MDAFAFGGFIAQTQDLVFYSLSTLMRDHFITW